MKLLPKSLLEIKAEMKILNILVFVAAFILVTGGLIFLNSIYNDIFKFDFSPISNKDSLSVASTVSPNDPSVEIKEQAVKKAKPLDAKDTTNNLALNVNLKNDTVTASIPKSKAIPQVIPVQNNSPNFSVNNSTEPVQQGEQETIIDRNLQSSQVDTIYQKWIKQTAKLYESMDPKKAALIIKNYSESTARDIIYKMKKKQAADILSKLDPITANRIAQFPAEKEKSSLVKN
jgi:MgtE intracellular N domain